MSDASRQAPADRREGVALAGLLLGAVFIGFSPIFVRLSELPPTATALYRMLLALPLFALWAVSAPMSREYRPPARRRWLLLSGALFAGDLAFWHWSITYTSVANATLLANSAPIFVTLIAWLLFDERINRRFVVALLLALAGAALLVRASFNAGGLHPLGDVLGLITAMFYAGYIVSIKALRRTMSTAALMAYSGAITTLLLFVFVLLAGEPLWPATLRGWIVVWLLAWVSQGLGQGLIAYGLAHLPASFSSLSLLLQPVVAALLAWAWLGESLDAGQMMGAFAVLAGIWLARRASRG